MIVEKEPHSNAAAFVQPEKEGRGDGRYSTVRWFALQLFASVCSHVMVRLQRANIPFTEIDQMPFFKRYDQLRKEAQEITDVWQRDGCYFYEPIGSIFLDYKIMRGRRMSITTPGIDDQAPRYYAEVLGLPDDFNIDADVLFERCLVEVDRWWL